MKPGLSAAHTGPQTTPVDTTVRAMRGFNHLSESLHASGGSHCSKTWPLRRASSVHPITYAFVARDRSVQQGYGSPRWQL